MKSLFTFEVNQKILKAAAFINLLMGFIITLMPRKILLFFGVELPYAIEFWQFFGVIVGVAGIGFYVASTDPGKHWPIVLVGFLGKLLAGFIFLKALATQSLPMDFALILIITTLIWTLPFYFILQAAYDEHISEDSPPKKFHDLLSLVRTSRKATLTELSQEKNVLLVSANALHVKEGKTYLSVPDSEEDSRNRKQKEIEVQPGISDGKKTEILSGVNEGQKVLIAKLNLEKKEGSSSPFSPMGQPRKR